MGFVKKVLEKEIFSNPIKYQRQCITRKEFVNSMQHSMTLTGHDGCVNTICWNVSGTLLASGSDDRSIIVWSEDGRKVKRINTSHKNNIFSVIFLYNSHDKFIVSAAGDNRVFLYDLEHLGNEEEKHVQQWTCDDRVKRLVTTPSLPRIFWSASEDGILRQYDARVSKPESLIDLSETEKLKSLAINDQYPEMIALALNKAAVPIYDRRNLSKPVCRLLPGGWSMVNNEGSNSALVTHLAFNKRGNEILVNIGSDDIYIYNVKESDVSSSPDVLKVLENFLKEEQVLEQETGPSLSKKIKKDTKVFDCIITKMNSYFNQDEYTKAIDLCSLVLNFYLNLNHLPQTPFTKTPLNDFTCSKVVKEKFDCINDLPALYFSRGNCYLNRQWCNDEMAALRDFLFCLQLQPNHPDAHFGLLKVLKNFNQFALLENCFELYKKRYNLNSEVKRFEESVNSLKKERPIFTSRELDYKNTPWSYDYYKMYYDYIDRFIGHYNQNTDIKEANWFGGSDEMIIAGSDCGSLFVWERSTQKVLKMFKADDYSVNCVQPHPSKFLVATSGIDPVIRFWEPARTAISPLLKDEIDDDRDILNQYSEISYQNQQRRKTNILDGLIGNPIFLFDASLSYAPITENSPIHCRSM